MTTYHPSDEEQRRTLRDARSQLFALGLFVAALCALVAWVSFTQSGTPVRRTSSSMPSLGATPSEL